MALVLNDDLDLVGGSEAGVELAEFLLGVELVGDQEYEMR